MIQINYVRYRTFTLSLRILSGAGTRFIRLNGCVRSQAKPKQGRYERRGNESSRLDVIFFVRCSAKRRQRAEVSGDGYQVAALTCLST
jgi:hypothetical protein